MRIGKRVRGIVFFHTRKKTNLELDETSTEKSMTGNGIVNTYSMEHNVYSSCDTTYYSSLQCPRLSFSLSLAHRNIIVSHTIENIFFHLDVDSIGIAPCLWSYTFFFVSHRNASIDWLTMAYTYRDQRARTFFFSLAMIKQQSECVFLLLLHCTLFTSDYFATNKCYLSNTQNKIF